MVGGVLHGPGMSRRTVFALAALASTLCLTAAPGCVDRQVEDDSCSEGETQPCDVDGDPGTQFCNVDDGEEVGEWSECFTDPGGSEGSTPIVLSFGSPVRYRQGGEAFDVDGGMSVVTDWPTAQTPWLVLDRDGDGRIADGRELFGSMTPLATGGVGENGFIALAELDEDGDGRLAPSDPMWSRLQVWADRDGDRRSSADELEGLEAVGVVAIGLTYRVDRRCDARGNCEVERASMIYRDALGFERVGEVVDVHLRHR